MEQTQRDHLSGMDLHIDTDIRQSLNESGKWTKFISITIFIICGLALILCLLGSAAMMKMMSTFSSRSSSLLGGFADGSAGILIAIIVFVIIIFAFVYYFLFNFSVKMKAALLSEDSGTFNKALGSLKTFFIITTVLSILSLLASLSSLFS